MFFSYNILFIFYIRSLLNFSLFPLVLIFLFILVFFFLLVHLIYPVVLNYQFILKEA